MMSDATVAQAALALALALCGDAALGRHVQVVLGAITASGGGRNPPGTVASGVAPGKGTA